MKFGQVLGDFTWREGFPLRASPNCGGVFGIVVMGRAMMVPRRMRVVPVRMISQRHAVHESRGQERCR